MRLKFIISAATCAVFPVSYMVPTFHIPMVVVVLVEMMASSLHFLSPSGVKRPPAGYPPSKRSVMSVVILFGVSVTIIRFQQGRVASASLGQSLAELTK
ncbi:hypothetical protein DPMN_142034 [Dreissena polymorpha]|uniref:Uncharacterized protein n=1 Tax=Dreissena polymorpha TaxID=45954 RepID=A0A9D4JLU2_DREPO|nr:hypothetical protein DPMN_142034 [Dreissena polymorpha]